MSCFNRFCSRRNLVLTPSISFFFNHSLPQLLMIACSGISAEKVSAQGLPAFRISTAAVIWA
jgi:hypothetical protein